MNNKYLIFFPLTIIAVFALCFKVYSVDSKRITKEKASKNAIYYYYSPIKDTFYMLGDEYVTISLREQRARVFTRQGDTFAYPVSSGNHGLSKGISTPTGLFTVQSKCRTVFSKQFNNAELTSWVGFNGNVGFHGLKGSGYYWNLGKRPSSHGCVRISREDGAKLYGKVHLGTPVLVYSDEPAVALVFSEIEQFAPGVDQLIERKDRATDCYIQTRISALYSGNYYNEAENKLFLDGHSVIRNKGFRIGEAEQISAIQRRHPVEYPKIISKSDRTLYNKLIVFKQDTTTINDSTKTTDKPLNG